ncbi:MAG: hypothetical protein HY271_12485 [Deltaproteobacteria bacterium]|nr:hypothetical protein [Deltaproteobacteria bacterium]
MKRAFVTTLLLGCVAAGTAFADSMIGAKVECQTEYGPDSETANACERGVDLATRTPDNIPFAISGCARDDDHADQAAACRRGVALHARPGARVRDGGQSSFAYSWKQGHGAVQVEIGNYDVLLGDAEKSMDDCMRSFEGSKTPPSCLSGLRVQPKPPGDTFRR